MLRATFAGFSTAFSSIQSNQKRLDIVGQNLANMNTPGYTRQELRTSSLNHTHPVSHYMNGAETVVGFGVHMDTVAQIRDPFLDGKYRDQMQKSGYTDGINTALTQLSRFLDESQINGIHSAFVDIQAVLNDMQDASKVNDPILESELRTKMQALTNLLNDADRQITKAEKDEFSRLDGTGTNENGAVQEVNEILNQISSLNRLIKDDQIFGQPALELMDERNRLLDELSSYIPIEVTYYKDAAHDGVDANGDTDSQAALNEIYHLDGNGDPFAKKDWPDDLRVEMVYKDKDGKTQRLTLVEGTVGTGTDNIGKVEVDPSLAQNNPFDASKVEMTFTGSKYYKDGKASDALLDAETVSFKKETDNTATPPTTSITNQFPEGSGSIQASLDMMWKDGSTAGIADVRGYEFYRNQLNNLAQSFAQVMNEINIQGNKDANGQPDPNQYLLANKTDNSVNNITAANIGINTQWSNGSVHIGKSGESANDTVLNLLEALQTTYPNNTFMGGAFKNIDLNGNSFADFMNHTSTILANDAATNQVSLKTNVTVLNGIQDSRDSVSGVSLDEEAANMMVYMSAYNAASRLMSTLDEALNILINNTGLVGR